MSVLLHGGVLGQGAAPYTPDATVLALGPAVWLDASSLSLADGDPVGAWADVSGNARNFTQATAGKKPIYKTSIANGKPVVRFAAASLQELVGPDLSALTAATFFVVVKVNADPPPSTSKSGLWDFGTDSAGSHYPFDGDGVIYDAAGTNSRKTTVNPTPSLSSAFHIYTVTSAAGAWTNYLDGSQLFTTATNTVALPAVTKLGHFQTAAQYLDGDVGELIVCGSALGSTDRTTIGSYLKTKYATP